MTPELYSKQFSQEEVLAQLEERRTSIASDISVPAQTDCGLIFEMLADMMDEDGALAELEDLDMLGIWLIADVRVEIHRKTELLDKGFGSPGAGQVIHPRQQLDLVCQRVRREDTFFGLVSGFERSWAISRSRSSRKPTAQSRFEWLLHIQYG